MKKNFPYLSLIILPVLLLITGSILKYGQGPYYLYFSDPSYEYLINSLNLAQLNGYGVGHFDHPGTTVQVIGAFVLKIHFFFNSQNPDIVIDVFSNPEEYLSVINKILVIINSLALLSLGFLTFKVSNNLYLSILIQLSPFISGQLFYGMHIVTPENFMIFVTLCFIGILIYYLFRIDINKKLPFSFVILFSAVCGLGLVTKLTFIPLLLIPLIIIKSFKYKILFIVFTLIFFLIFFSPALSNYEGFIDWVKRLTINNGRYGYGEPSVIDFSIFYKNILRIFLRDMFFGIIYFITLTVLIINKFFVPRNDDLELKSVNKESKLLLGIFLAFTCQIIMVGKHYDQHYMIPSFMLSVTSLLLSLRILSNIFKKHFHNYNLNHVYVILIVLVTSLSLLQGIFYYKEITEQKQEAFKIQNFIKSNYSDALVIPALGGANQESAMAFSTYYSGSQTARYRNILSQTLSSHIFYNSWTRQLYPISKQIKIKDEILNSKKIILQISDPESIYINEFIDVLKKYCSLENPTYKKVFSNGFEESVYEVYIN